MQYFVSASYNMLGMNGGILANKVHPKRIYHILYISSLRVGDNGSVIAMIVL